ncbi:hypothetical protein BaRGS_00005354 [Batillaria attramentaria]|uniref:Uncharacterized protein n=1 Tax=Batillaria attramentaria TaxID=370345 RepID=A0ABD0LWF9_9CAEN
MAINPEFPPVKWWTRPDRCHTLITTLARVVTPDDTDRGFTDDLQKCGAGCTCRLIFFSLLPVPVPTNLGAWQGLSGSALTSAGCLFLLRASSSQLCLHPNLLHTLHGACKASRDVPYLATYDQN